MPREVRSGRAPHNWTRSNAVEDLSELEYHDDPFYGMPAPRVVPASSTVTRDNVTRYTANKVAKIARMVRDTPKLEYFQSLFDVQ